MGFLFTHLKDVFRHIQHSRLKLYHSNFLSGITKKTFNKHVLSKWIPKLTKEHYSSSLVVFVYCVSASEERSNNYLDPATYSHDFLIRQTSIGAVEAAIRVLTYLTVAILDSHKEYKKILDEYLHLMDENLIVVGCATREDEIWQHIIAVRALVNNVKNQITALESKMISVSNLINSAAETAFITGADYLAIEANERLASSLQQIKLSKEEYSTLEKEVLLKQTKLISETASDSKDEKETERE